MIDAALVTHRRALALNLSGSAVSNVLPLGGVAGTALNFTMTRTWGHSSLDFARFVVVSKSCDLIAKLVLPGVALVGLLSCGVVAPATGGAVLVPAGAAFAAGLLVLWALCGRPVRVRGRRPAVPGFRVRRGDPGRAVMVWWWAARRVRIRLGRGSPSDGTHRHADSPRQ